MQHLCRTCVAVVSQLCRSCQICVAVVSQLSQLCRSCVVDIRLYDLDIIWSVLSNLFLCPVLDSSLVLRIFLFMSGRMYSNSLLICFVFPHDSGNESFTAVRRLILGLLSDCIFARNIYKYSFTLFRQRILVRQAFLFESSQYLFPARATLTDLLRFPPMKHSSLFWIGDKGGTGLEETCLSGVDCRGSWP